MNTVMIIPTGLGFEIGGHAGDATPAARLLGAVSDTLILHPNVVNASDINEMPANALYVDGYMLDSFLMGSIELCPVKSNRILVAVNKPVKPETVNAVSTARTTLGIDARIIELDTKLVMDGWVEDGMAGGSSSGIPELIDQVKQNDFDALAIATLIGVKKEVAMTYFKEGGVNPWGGIEAAVSRAVSSFLNKPVAHAPVEADTMVVEDYMFVSDPRMAAEMISQCYLHCVLKGLHKAPRVGAGISYTSIDVMVSPMCWGRPHKACNIQGIPIIMVEGNMTEDTIIKHDEIPAANYLEAAGIIAAMGAGICLDSVRRPLKGTVVI